MGLPGAAAGAQVSAVGPELERLSPTSFVAVQAGSTVLSVTPATTCAGCRALSVAVVVP